MQVSFSTLKTWTGLQRAHLEPMKGKPYDSLVYCTKQDKNPIQYGDLPQPGKRTDLLDAVAKIRTGASLRDLVATDDTSSVVVAKYFRGLTTVRNLCTPDRDTSSAPDVYWIYGTTGSGKTRSVSELAQRVCGGQHLVWWAPDVSLKWFDGYDGQPCVVLDDFRSKGVSFNFLLRLLDRYPLAVPFKGGFVSWQPKWVFITCPLSIDATFAKRLEHRSEDIDQLKRRINKGEFEFPQDKCRLGRCLGLEPVSKSKPVPVPVPGGRDQVLEPTDGSLAGDESSDLDPEPEPGSRSDSSSDSESELLRLVGSGDDFGGEGDYGGDFSF